MPIYEYRCSTCSHELETLQKFSDPPLTDCPACGKASLVKKISAAGFQLKGTGWYATDFKGSSKPAAKEDGKTGDSKAGESKGGESKTDGKSGEGNAGESKSGDSKSAESSSGSKSETKSAAPAPATGTGG